MASPTYYTPGTPLTPGVVYALDSSAIDATLNAYVLNSNKSVNFWMIKLPPEPVQANWSDVAEGNWVVKGDIANELFKFDETEQRDCWFMIPTPVMDPTQRVDAMYGLVASFDKLGIPFPDEYEIASTIATEAQVNKGFYLIENLVQGKMYALNIYPQLGGLQETEPQPDFTFALWNVQSESLLTPTALLAAGNTTEQVMFVAQGSDAVLKIDSSLDTASFFVRYVNFELASSGGEPPTGDYLTASEDAVIEGSWIFSNTIKAPELTTDNQNGLKLTTSGTDKPVQITNGYLVKPSKTGTLASTDVLNMGEMDARYLKGTNVGGATFGGLVNLNGGASSAAEVTVPNEITDTTAVPNFNLTSGVLLSELFNYPLLLGAPTNYGTAGTATELKAGEVYSSTMPNGLYQEYPLTKLYAAGNPAIRAVYIPFWSQYGDSATVKLCFTVGRSGTRSTSAGGVDDWLWSPATLSGQFSNVVEITLYKSTGADMKKVRVRTMYRASTGFVLRTVESSYTTSTSLYDNKLGNNGFLGFIWAAENAGFLNRDARAGVWGVKCDGRLMFLGDSAALYSDTGSNVSSILVASYDDYTAGSSTIRIGVPKVYLAPFDDKSAFYYSALKAAQFMPDKQETTEEV